MAAPETAANARPVVISALLSEAERTEGQDDRQSDGQVLAQSPSAKKSRGAETGRLLGIRRADMAAHRLMSSLRERELHSGGNLHPAA